MAPCGAKEERWLEPTEQGGGREAAGPRRPGHPALAFGAVGSREEIEAALPGVRRVLWRGLITLTEVDLYEPAS